MKRIYIDHNATTPLDPEVLEAFSAFSRDCFGNPSSIHWAGREAKRRLEEAREEVAALVGADPSEVIFTSGGTEADNFAIKGVVAAMAAKGSHIVTSSVEHPAVAATCDHLERQGVRVTRVPVGASGELDPEAVKKAICADTVLMTFMFANNETGVIFPIQELGEIATERKIYLHCDAVQAAGRVAVDVRAMGIHLAALSAHKINGPKGVGALIARKGVKLHSLIHGGPQERNRRGGTENAAGIVAFGAACRLARERGLTEMPRVSALRDRLEAGLLALIPDAKINGGGSRLGNTLNVSFHGTQADLLLMSLDLAGIAASSGSACGSGTVKNSPVLAAMGVDPVLARGSIRFSLGKENNDEDVDRILQVLPGIVSHIRNEQDR